MKRLFVKHSNQNEVIGQTCEVLQKGGLVVFPSDTVYGLLVDATNKKAVEKLLEFKKRPKGKPISMFTDGFNMMQKYVEILPEQLKRLKHILPGSYTIVLPSRHQTSELLEAENGSMGVRYVNYPYVQHLIEAFGRPTTATSANTSGRRPHYTVDSLLQNITNQQSALIDLVVDTGRLPYKKPSTVVDYSKGNLKILRKGSGKFKKTSNRHNMKTRKHKTIIENSIISHSTEETFEVGRKLGDKIKKGGQPTTILLYGDLGAGKTVFVKGVAYAFGITDIVSPTYVVLYEYKIETTLNHESVKVLKQENNEQTKKNFKNSKSESDSSIGLGMTKKFVHVDLYNVQDMEELEHVNLQAYIEGNNVVCVEWSEKILSTKLKPPPKVIEVKIEQMGENTRVIVCSYL